VSLRTPSTPQFDAPPYFRWTRHAVGCTLTRDVKTPLSTFSAMQPFARKAKQSRNIEGPCATANADKHCLLLMKTFERAMTMIRGEFSARSHSQTSADLIGLLSVVFDQRCTLAEKLTHPARRVIGVPILALQRERLEQIRTRLQNEAMNDARNNKIFKP
jgi:hypothetical protein